MINELETKAVPLYQEDNLRNKVYDYCLCIFVINESERLHDQLDRIKFLGLSVDIVVCDGGSTDGSTNLDILFEKGVSTLLTKKDTGKLGTQMRMAFDWAIHNSYKGVITIDGNNKDSVESIPTFIEKLECGYDHIQGSRFIDGGRAINTPLSRLFGVKFIHAPLMCLASGFKYTDTTNGFRAYSSHFLKCESVNIFRCIFESYEFHYYLAVLAPKQGYRCLEIPVTRTYPKGKIPTKISPIRGNLTVLSKLIKVVCGYYTNRS